MKKRLIIIIQISIFSLVNSVYGQNSSDLNSNNVMARLTTNGVFFNDHINGLAAYQIPENQSNSLIYASAFWFGGLDGFNNLHLSAQKYGLNQDLYSGPIADDYSNTEYIDNFADKIWLVSESDVNTHLLNYNSLNYVVPDVIENWPAHGNVDNGEGSDLAPFVDLNHNGIYDPVNGDYPNIRGVSAAYLIFNDQAGLHTESGGEALGMEFHFMFYVYATNDNLNNTTFINLKVINRSPRTYSNFKVGQFTDGDLGGSSDDYFGSSPQNNMMFTYNGDNSDSGFGTVPPAVGLKILNHDMNVAGYFSSTASSNESDPINASDFWGYMNAEWKNSGIHFTEGGSGYAGTVNTNFLYSSNPNDISGWSEQSEMNPPGDRRMFMATNGITLSPNEEVCYDYAVIYALGNSSLNSIDSLYEVAEDVQSFYDAQLDYTCENIVLNLPKLNNESQINIFPNPSEGVFTINGIKNHSKLYLYTTDGKLIKEINVNLHPTFQFDISNFKTGNYILKIVNDKGVHVQKISVK